MKITNNILYIFSWLISRRKIVVKKKEIYGYDVL